MVIAAGVPLSPDRAWQGWTEWLRNYQAQPPRGVVPKKRLLAQDRGSAWSLERLYSTAAGPSGCLDTASGWVLGVTWENRYLLELWSPRILHQDMGDS